MRLLLAILLLIVAGGVGYEQLSRHSAASRYPPEGEFVQVNGHALHVVRRGTGAPTVVLESGIAPGGHLAWRRVQSRVAADTTTLSYDRAGVLWSEQKNSPFSCASGARDLQALLTATAVPEPYILVGHSAAALLFRCYYAVQSDKVAGIVLVDPSHPDLLSALPEEIVSASMPLPGWLATLLNDVGVARLRGEFSYPGLDPGEAINQQVGALSGRGLPAIYAEMNGVTQLAEDAGNAGDFGDVPLIVISGTAPERFDLLVDDPALANEVAKTWEKMQLASVALSSHGRRITAANSGHSLQLERPELVAEAITTLLRPR